MSRKQVNMTRIYELLWIATEVKERLLILNQELKCSHDCTECMFEPCERALKVKLCHPMRKKAKILFPEEPYPCSLDSLPSLVLDKIFQFCRPKEMMTMSRAFPQYKKRAMCPAIWKEIYLHDCCMSEKEVFMLLRYLNPHVKTLKFIRWMDLTIEKFEMMLDLVHCLTSIEFIKSVEDFSEDFSEFSEVIVDKCPNLIEYEISDYVIDEEAFQKFAGLKNIQKLGCSSDETSIETLREVLSTLKNLKKFDFLALYMDNEYETFR
jgi:hypothetical protein